MSDIHIGVYRTYNQDDFRLKQFIKLKNIVCQTILAEEIKEVWIAGDLLLAPQSSPQVMSVAKSFLKDISKLAKIRLILGNHDVLVRTDKTDISEYTNYTLISLMDSIENLEIYTDSIEVINNKKVYFRSWTPSPFERRDAEYLVCHGDTHKSLSPFSEHYIDCSGYKKVFCGHIHIYKEIDNIISLGTPLMHSFSDSQDVGFLIYDLDSDTSKRISTKGMFLEFKYAENEEKAKELNEEVKERNQDAVIRVKEEVIEETIKDISITDLAIDPRNAIKDFTDGLCEDSVNAVNCVVSDGSVNIEVPDLKVNFKVLKGENFLSIKKIVFNFEDFSNLTVIRGDIGSGKSTLFNLIEFMLFGKLSGYTKSDFQSVYSDRFKGYLELEYKNSTYVIERTLSTLQYSKDGKSVEFSKKNDLQKELEEELSFLKFWNLIYIKQSSTGIFSDMSDTSRVSFLSNLIGLNAIKTWTDNLAEFIKSKSDAVKNDNDEKIKLQMEIKSLNDYNELNKNHSSYINIDSLNDKSSEYQKQLNALNDRKNKNLNEIGKYTDDLRKNRSILENAYNTVKNANEIIIKIRELEKTNEDLNNSNMEFKEVPDISDARRNIALIDDKLFSLSAKLNLCKEKLKSLSEHPDICPTCKQPWHIPDIENKISILSNGVAELSENINKLRHEKDVENQKIYDYTEIVNHNGKIQEIRHTINSNNSLITEKKGIVKMQLESVSNVLNIRYTDNGIQVVDEILKNEDDLKTCIEKLQNENIDIDIQIQNILQEVYDINQKIGTAKINNEIYKNILCNAEKIEDINVKIQGINNRIEGDNKVIDELSKFNSKVLSDKGLLVASLLQKVSNYLNNDDNLKVETVHELQNGSLKPTLNIKLFVKEYGKYVDYGLLSGGQRLQADLRFLKGITNTLGTVSMLMMDETFKYFSTDAVYAGLDIINDMKVNKVFLILHGMDNECISKNIITVKLTENGSVYEYIKNSLDFA